jgi:phospholipid/cholesterol/gamma-HCH transport system substrate-binding protein
MSRGGKYNHGRRLEIVAGSLTIAVAVFLALFLVRAVLLRDQSYILYAEFASVSGIHTGDPVTIAGVEVGTVESINLTDYQARLGLKIRNTVEVRSDAVASIESAELSLVDDKTVSIDPGFSGKRLHAGEVIAETESAQSFQDMIIQHVGGDIIAGG